MRDGRGFIAGLVAGAIVWLVWTIGKAFR